MDPLAVVALPIPLTWSAIESALALAELVVVTTDVRVDDDDARARFEASADRLIGPASGGARWPVTPGVAPGIAIATRVGSGFDVVVADLDVLAAVDLGLGWGLDEAALIERWAETATVIGLVSPRPSPRLAHALMAIRGRVPVVVLDPRGADWSPLGARSVGSLAAFRLALTLGPIASAPALVGASRPALDAVRAALEADGSIGTRPASEAAALTITEEVHTRAEVGAVVDLTGLATARHVRHAVATLAHEGPVLVVDGALAADPRALVEAIHARRAVAAQAPVDLAPAPAHADAMRAQALVAAAVLMKRAALGRDQALALAAAMHLGTIAPTIQVASLGAAIDAIKRLGGAPFMGAPGVAPRPADDLEATWEAIATALAPTDPYAARWVATVPREAAHASLVVTLAIGRGPVGPVLAWSHGDQGGAIPLPATTADAARTGLPLALLGAVSFLALALPDVARLALTGVVADGRVVFVDGDGRIEAEDGA